MFDVSGLVAHWGYLAVFVIVVLGNVGLPVPEETALLAAGYLVWRGDLRLSLVLTVGIVSAVVGDNLGYWIGRRWGQGAVERFRRLIGIPSQRFESMRGVIVRWGPLGVFVARFIAGLRFLAGPLAGACGLHFTTFISANVLGAIVYVPVAVGAELRCRLRAWPLCGASAAAYWKDRVLGAHYGGHCRRGRLRLADVGSFPTSGWSISGDRRWVRRGRGLRSRLRKCALASRASSAVGGNGLPQFIRSRQPPTEPGRSHIPRFLVIVDTGDR